MAVQKRAALGLADGEGEDVDMGEDEQRRQRRRSNNRESAKRIKEKRHADLREVSDKVHSCPAHPVL